MRSFPILLILLATNPMSASAEHAKINLDVTPGKGEPVTTPSTRRPPSTARTPGPS